MTAPIGYPEKFGALLNQRPLDVTQTAAREAQRPQPTGEALGVKPAPSSAATPPSFSEHLSQFVNDIDHSQKAARTQAEEFAVGHTNDIHGTMIAVEQAEISLRLFGNVRNRVVDLYREVMRMGS
jgi:flagellar hook-basal body complex protein FliE